MELLLITLAASLCTDVPDTSRGAVSPCDYCSLTSTVTPCPTSTQSWNDTFDRMLLSEECAPVGNIRKGCDVELPVGDLHFDREVEVPRPVRFFGGGGGLGATEAGSTLHFPCASRGIWVPGWGSQAGGGYNGNLPGIHIGEGMELYNLELQWDFSCVCRRLLPDPPGCSDYPASHGVEIAGTIQMDNVLIRNPPGRGIYFSTPNGGNPSESRLRKVLVVHSGYEGLLIDGPTAVGANSNQMSLEQVSVIEGCGSDIATSDCYNYTDRSLLGNIHIAPHVNAPCSRAYNFNEAPSAHSLLLYPYEEDWSAHCGGGYSKLKYATAIQGTLNPDPIEGTCHWGAAGFQGSCAFRSQDEVRTLVGDPAPDTWVTFEKTTPGAAASWNFWSHPTLNMLAARVSTWSLWAFGLTSFGTRPPGYTEDLAAGRLWISDISYQGPINAPIAHLTTLTTPPAGTWPEGSRCIKLRPQSGDISGWVYVNGAWLVERRVE